MLTFGDMKPLKPPSKFNPEWRRLGLSWLWSPVGALPLRVRLQAWLTERQVEVPGLFEDFTSISRLDALEPLLFHMPRQLRLDLLAFRDGSPMTFRNEFDGNTYSYESKERY